MHPGPKTRKKEKKERDGETGEGCRAPPRVSVPGCVTWCKKPAPGRNVGAVGAVSGRFWVSAGVLGGEGDTRDPLAPQTFRNMGAKMGFLENPILACQQFHHLTVMWPPPPSPTPRRGISWGPTHKYTQCVDHSMLRTPLVFYSTLLVSRVHTTCPTQGCMAVTLAILFSGSGLERVLWFRRLSITRVSSTSRSKRKTPLTARPGGEEEKIVYWFVFPHPLTK